MSSICLSPGISAIYTIKAAQAVLCLHKLYKNWNYLRQHPDISTFHKIRIVFDGAMNGVDIWAIAAFFQNRGFQQTHARLHRNYSEKHVDVVLKGLRRLLSMNWSDLADPNSAVTRKAFGDLRKADDALAEIKKVVKSYQEINARFAKIQFISLSLSLSKHLVENGISKKMDNLIEIFFSKAANAFYFFSNSQCDNYLDNSFRNKLILYPLQFASSFLFCLEFVTFVRTHSQGSQPIAIGEFTLIKFSFPFIPNGDVQNYLKMPEQYFDREPFTKYICLLTKKPITKALFVLTSETFFLFEKEALISYCFEQMHASQPLIIPDSQIRFDLTDLYVDPAFDIRLASHVIQLRIQEHDKLQARPFN